VFRWIRDILGMNTPGRPRIALWPVLLALLLASHSFDPCASHTSLLSSAIAPTELSQKQVRCSAPPQVACLCEFCVCLPQPTNPLKDGCGATSELSTLPASLNFLLDPPVAAASAFAILPNTCYEPVALLVGLGRDREECSRLRPQFSPSHFSGRAPPLFA
jgi:hypothetical protein